MTDKQLAPSRFIPFRMSDLVTMCRDGGISADQSSLFEDFAGRLSQLFHAEFKREQDALKQAYASLDPDADTRAVFANSEQDAEQFIEQLKAVLNKANYEAITPDELNQAMSRSSLFNLRLRVDFDDFSDVLLFCRGESLRKEQVNYFFGLRSREVEFVNYERVVVYVRYRETYQSEKGEWLATRPGASLLKLFQNVPKADLEMLFPNTQLQMRLKDKLMIGIPAVVSGGVVLTTKMGATLILLSSMVGFWFGLKQEPVELNMANLTILFAGLGALGAFFWKQFSKFKNRKLRFMQQLTQNLYFKNLDNNAGVIFRLLNDAEEEESKEALLAYYFLISVAPMAREHLDQHIEAWLAEHWQCSMDFEIEDALQKLLRLGIVSRQGELYMALPLPEAMTKLEQRWISYLSA